MPLLVPWKVGRGGLVVPFVPLLEPFNGSGANGDEKLPSGADGRICDG